MKHKLKGKIWHILIAVLLITTFVGSCKKDKFEESPGVCPTVIATNPFNGALAVPLNQVVSVTFNEKMDPSTMGPECFELSGANKVLGTFNYNDNIATITFIPSAPLLANTTYTGRVKTSVRDMRGNALQKEYVWSFSTGLILTPIILSTIPLNNAVDVEKTQVISATFSYLMDPLSIKDSSFKVLVDGVPIAGVVSTIDSTAYFTPSNDLLPGKEYTATITTMVKTLNKGNMASNYTWKFTSKALVQPTIILTYPISNQTGIPLNQVVRAKFSMPMDVLSLKDSSYYISDGTNKILGTISYLDSVVSFTPSIPLLPTTVYTATITTMAKSVEGAPMASNYVWSFTTITPVAPTVILTDPIANAVGVLQNKTITANFSVAMDPTTITASSFTLSENGNPVSAVISYLGTTATLNPNVDLLPNKVYTATISNTVKNVAGTNMVNNYAWSFTTISPLAPTIILVDPIANAIGVSLNKTITANFSVAMDPTTITASTFTLSENGNPVSAAVSYLGITASLNPNVDLLPNKLYTATVTNSVKSLAGINMVLNYVWSFTTLSLTAPTVVLTDPSANAIGVALNKTVTADFSTAMDPLTISGSTFTLSENGNPVSAVVSYLGTTASLNPNSDLLPNTLYTATVTNSVKNLAGTNMVSNHVWTFTTVANLAPTVISTDPSHLATNVLLNKVLSATFSVPMDPSSITNLTFTLKLGLIPVTGVVNYSGSTATFTPTINLLSGNVYTATITTGAKNMAGTFLASNHVWTFTTKNPSGPLPPNLNSVARFGIIAGVGVTNQAGFSVINNMDVGISPGVRSSVAGFPPAIINNGAIYASDDIAPPLTGAMLLQAKADLMAAYLYARDAVLPAPATVSGDQGGLTLAPGIYKSTSILLIQNGNLTLDAQGDANAVWIFQVGSALTTTGGAGGNVILTNGAQAKNVYWQVSSSATIGDYTSFQGNVLALTSITMNSHATITGRILCSNGAVVMTSTNTINKP